MNAPVGSSVIKSTSDLTPDGILGYAKGIAVFVGGALTVINEQVVPDDWPYKGWLTAAIAICTLIAAVAIPNPVKPVIVPPPAPNVDPDADHVLQAPVDPDPLLGVVDPPGRHAEDA